MYADEWKPTFKIVFHSHVCQSDGLSDTAGYLGIFLQVQRYNFISIFTQRSRFRNTSKLIARLLNSGISTNNKTTNKQTQKNHQRS